MGVGWKARIEKRGREKTRGWERSFGGRGRLFIAVGRRRTGAARGRRAGGVPEARNTWMDGRADMSGDGDTSARRRLLSRTGWASALGDKFMRLRSKFFGAFYRQFLMPVELDWIMKPRSSTAVATGTLHCAFCSRKP